MASAIQKMGLTKGSKIGIFSKNCAHWILADIAIWLSGNVSVPLYPNLNNETVNLIIEHSDMELLFLGKLDKSIKSQLNIKKKITTVSFPYEQFPDTLNWDKLVAENTEYTGPQSRDHKDLATIVYTSGTTGLPKGVMHSFDTLAFCGTNAMPALRFVFSKERFFSYLPLAHVAERYLVELMGLYSGASIAFVESQDTFVRDVQEAKPTVFLAVPRIWAKFQEGILKKLPQKKLDLINSIPILSYFIHKKIRKGLGLDHVKLPVTGSASTPADTMLWYAKLGIHIQEAYGMTENMAYSHLNYPGKIKFGSVGQPFTDVEVKQTPEGEILVKSRATMMGYYKDEEKTKEQIVDGFLRTGDLGEIDKDGYLKITGRAKDLFKTSKGKYVAPGPIELELSKSVLIEQVCVVGDGLPQPMALAILTETAMSKPATDLKTEVEGLLAEINKQLNQHERLSRIVLMTDTWTTENGLLTPTLKVKRNVVEKKYITLIPSWAEGKEKVLQA